MVTGLGRVERSFPGLWGDGTRAAGALWLGMGECSQGPAGQEGPHPAEATVGGGRALGPLDDWEEGAPTGASLSFAFVTECPEPVCLL